MESTIPDRRLARYEALYATALALFVALVLMTNTAGVKLFTVFGLTLPVSILVYPATFLVTDVVSEIYGARRARYLVATGFAASVLLLAVSMLGIALPAAPGYILDEDYRRIFGPVWRLLFGSMAAYLLAQMIDVQLFHFWKRYTKGKHLWLRNNGSTMLSQFVDSFTVNTIFLYRNPAVFDGGFDDVMAIVFATYAVKVLIAAADTPLCYAGVRFAERYTGVRGVTVS